MNAAYPAQHTQLKCQKLWSIYIIQKAQERKDMEGFQYVRVLDWLELWKKYGYQTFVGTFVSDSLFSCDFVQRNTNVAKTYLYYRAFVTVCFYQG